jgi:signal transduction histidine kinase
MPFILFFLTVFPILLMGQESNVNSFQSNTHETVQEKLAYIDSLSNSNGSLREIARTYTDLAWININQTGNIIDAQKYVSIGDSIANILNDTSMMAETQTILGRIYLWKGYYATSLEYQSKAYDLKAVLRDTGRMAYSVNLMGRVFLTQEKYKEALSFYLEGMKLKDAVGQADNVILVSRSIALCYLHLGDYQQAREYADHAFSLVKDGTRRSARIYLILAKIDLAERKYGDALCRAKRSDMLMDTHGATVDQAASKNLLAKVYLAVDSVENAHAVAEIAYNLAVQSNHAILVIEALLILQEVAELQGDLKYAFQIGKELLLRKDSFHRQEEINKSLDFETLYRVKERDQQILNLQSEQKKALASILTKKRENKLLLIVLLITTILLSGLVWLIHYKRKTDNEMANKDLIIQQQRIKELEQQKKSVRLRSMVEGQEKERMRLSQEIHDGLGGMLSTAKTYLTKMDESDSKLLRIIDQTCHEVREITHNLMPVSLQVVGLNGAIEDLAAKSEMLGIDCTIELHQVQIEEEQMKLAIYRIIQELVNNVIKHAGSTHLLIQLIQYDHNIHILVEDDGKGYDPTISNGGMGLQNIRSRLEVLNGTMEVESNKETGTTVSIDIPIIPNNSTL